jgi:ABC-2 type transport system permease protein
MSVREALQPMSRNLGSHGFRVLLRKENRTWWGGRRWLVQALFWLFVINGLVAMVLFVIPNTLPAEGDSAFGEDLLFTAVQGFFSVGSVALGIGVIVLAQDAILGEKQSGTAEWLLSKPVSRAAFLLAKLVAHTLGAVVILILLQSLVAYLLLSTAGSLSPLAFLAGVGVLTVHTLFYLALTLMMGVLSENRGLILGVPLGFLLAGSLLSTFKPLLIATPWGLGSLETAVALATDVPAILWLPLVATVGWTVAFVFVAIWRFERVEF